MPAQTNQDPWHLYFSPTATVQDVTDADIKQYVDAIVADPNHTQAEKQAAIKQAMLGYRVPLARVLSATGYTEDQAYEYLGLNPNNRISEKRYSDADVKSFIEGVVTDPNKSNEQKSAEIKQAIIQYNVPLDQVLTATGYTRAQADEFLGLDPADNAAVAANLTDEQIKSYVTEVLNNPGMSDAQKKETIKTAMTEYNVSAARVASATGYTPAQVTSYLGLDPTAVGQRAATGPIADLDVKNYIANVLNDPNMSDAEKRALITNSMIEFDVQPEQIVRATGYGRGDVYNYLGLMEPNQPVPVGVDPRPVTNPDPAPELYYRDIFTTPPGTIVNNTLADGLPAWMQAYVDGVGIETPPATPPVVTAPVVTAPPVTQGPGATTPDPEYDPNVGGTLPGGGNDGPGGPGDGPGSSGTDGSSVGVGAVGTTSVGGTVGPDAPIGTLGTLGLNALGLAIGAPPGLGQATANAVNGLAATIGMDNVNEALNNAITADMGNPNADANAADSEGTGSTTGSPSSAGGGDSGDGGTSGGSDGVGDAASAGVGGGGWAKGGYVDKKHLKGPNPKGPDDGWGALDHGEYVIPAHIVRALGRQYFDNLIKGKK